jgi:hypothetical protein
VKRIAVYVYSSRDPEWRTIDRVYGVVIVEKPDDRWFTCYDEFDAAAKYVGEVLGGTNIINNHNNSLTYDKLKFNGEFDYQGTLYFKHIGEESTLIMSEN